MAAALGEVELVPLTTAGDRSSEPRFERIAGGRGVFTRELERALLAGEADLAVHSAKDLTGAMPEGLVLAAVLPRDDPRDAVCGPYRSLEEIPAGARIGTSSARRAGLIAELRPDLRVVPMRGNVDTRLRKLDAGEADAIVLAACGLERLGLGARIGFRLDPQVFVPEAGQGALAVQVRAGEEEAVRALDDARSRAAYERERAEVDRLGGGCSVPVAAHAWYDGEELRLRTWTGT